MFNTIKIFLIKYWLRIKRKLTLTAINIRRLHYHHSSNPPPPPHPPPCIKEEGLTSSNLAIKVRMKYFSRKGGVGLKGGLLRKGGREGGFFTFILIFIKKRNIHYMWVTQNDKIMLSIFKITLA